MLSVPPPRALVRLLLCALGIGVGLLLPAAAEALSPEEARHLLARSGFAATPAGIEALAGLDRQAAAEAVLPAAGATARTAPPAWTEDWVPPQQKGVTEAERLALRDTLLEQARDLKAWWLDEMLATPSPLTEMMTLFWHSHFT